MTKNTISGFFIINKPKGLTSHDVVAEIRRMLKVGLPAGASAKAGHTGTLDPMATGVLIVAVGDATRLIQHTHGFPKTYQAEITLGATSTTDDATGIITHGTPQGCTMGQVEEVLKTFVGEIKQIPPRYAAIKIKGKKLYEYARRGQEVTPPARSVTIHALKLISYHYPHLSIEATVSTGTYIRALARDLGEKLKMGAYLSKLHRQAIGPWTDKKSVKLENINSDNWQRHLRPASELVQQ